MTRKPTAPKRTPFEQAWERARVWGWQKTKNETAKTFQEMIRAEAMDADGYITCVTCGAVHKNGINEIDAGHFVGGRECSILFEETNCHPQCKGCNKGLRSNTEAYREFMIAAYGIGEVERLEQLKRHARQISKIELIEMREKFKARVKMAEARLK